MSRRDWLHGAAMALLAAAGAARLTASPAEASDAIDDPRLALINRLCDLVIPATGTAGGAAVGAGQFVLLAVDHRMTGLSPAALSLVHTHLDAAGGRPFLRLAAAQQTRLLTELDDKAFAGPAGAPDAGISTPEQAWRLLKPAIIAGYYTSQIGASRELVYEPVPDTTRVNFILHADYRSRSNEGFGGDL